MARASWLVDSKRIATKIKSASSSEPQKVVWKSNPSRACPNCNHVIDNSDVTQDWPGLPRGVKFDPSDQELIWHLSTKLGISDDITSHPFIDEFIPTVEEEDGICYTHPKRLPGVKNDGTVSHFFHRTMKAYNTGTRKRRKIQNELDPCLADVRWHKTGKTKPIIVDGLQVGCKKIMVLYMNTGKGEKPEKTNWVMHQYHLGTEEEENDGVFVVSKIFFQQQQPKTIDKNNQGTRDEPKESTSLEASLSDPAHIIPNTTSTEKCELDLDLVQHILDAKDSFTQEMDPQTANGENGGVSQLECEKLVDHNGNSSNMLYGLTQPAPLITDPVQTDLVLNSAYTRKLIPIHDPLPEEGSECKESFPQVINPDTANCGNDASSHQWEKLDDHNDNSIADPKWWEGESQFLLDSQQLAEGLYMCDEILQSQSSTGGNTKKSVPCLAEYSLLGAANLKKDLEECQSLARSDLTNVDLDICTDLRLSQLDVPIGSQDSLGWTDNRIGD